MWRSTWCVPSPVVSANARSAPRFPKRSTGPAGREDCQRGAHRGAWRWRGSPAELREESTDDHHARRPSGAGKTTLAGKLGYWLKDSGHTPLLVAADLQRPNAVTQLQVVGERAGVPVYAPEKGVQSDGGEAVASPGLTTGDPVKVARDAVALAKQKLYDTVIIDTAGRLGVDEELMKQARDIRDAVQPNEILFVIDAMIGQDAVQTAKAFDEGVDFTGVVLSKLDGDARGGAALSVASVTGKPILFASTGEGLKDFEVFHPDRMASRILDMGDILTLIEQAQKQFDEEEARKAAIKISDGSFGLDDFLDQLQQVRKLVR